MKFQIPFLKVLVDDYGRLDYMNLSITIYEYISNYLNLVVS